jgi:hypothetical protein
MVSQKSSYTGEKIKVLEGLEGVRKQFDVIEISRKIKRQGDILTLSNELKIDYNSLKRAVEESRILQCFPNINKSKVMPLSRLRTRRDISNFSKSHNIMEFSTRGLYKVVKKWNENIQKNPSLLLSREEQNIIIGTLLGDANIKKRDRTSCLRIAHSFKQEEYMNWKIAKLSFLGISEHTKKRRIINNREVNMIYFATRTHPVFNYYRNLFYRFGRKILTKDILRKLNPQSLAIWICDDGSYSATQSYIILCTNSYSLEEHELMKKFFNEKFGLNPTIGFRDKKYYYLRFKQKDTKKLIAIIKSYLPKSMLYKIGGK